MAFDGLKNFVSYLESRGELQRIKCFADPQLEITEIADRCVKSNGKALLFENTGTPFPLLINMFASDSRMAAALGRPSTEDAGKEMLTLFDSLGKEHNFAAKLSRVPDIIKLATITPRKRSGRGRCQDIVSDKPDLSVLPVLKCWPHDGGRFITLPLVHTIHPLTGKTNLGMYRMQVMDTNRTGMHWHMHKTGANHFRAWKERGGKMPVTVTLGGDPVYTYAATAPVPENIDEYILAGFLRKKRVSLVKCLTNDLWVPEDSDIVIEGYVDTSEELVNEGPFGDHTGFYSLADIYPAFHVTCITYRRDAVYPATIVGVPPMEDAWIGKATEKIFFAPLKLAIAPEIQDMHMPVQGVAHNLVLVSVEKSYPGQGMKVLNSLMGAGQMMFSKYIIVFSGNVSLTDYRIVARTFFANLNFATDMLFSHGPMDILDHASDTPGFGGKLGLDATEKLRGEKEPAQPPASLPVLTLNDFDTRQVTALRAPGELSMPLAIITIKKQKGGHSVKNLLPLLPAALATEGFITVALDHGADISDTAMVTWLALGNSDPARDIYRLDSGGIFLDATSKPFSLPPFPREWPNVVCSGRETIDLVDKRWNEYNLGDLKPSPSLKLFPLLMEGDASVEKNEKMTT